MSYLVNMQRVSELSHKFCDSMSETYTIDEVVFASLMFAATALQQANGVKFTRDECFFILVDTIRNTILEEEKEVADGHQD